MDGANAYQLVFEAGQSWLPWMFPAAGLVFVAIGTIVVRWSRAAQPGPRRYLSRPRGRVFAAVYLGFSAIYAAVAAIAVVSSRCSIQRAIRDGRTVIVEGTVRGFHPTRYGDGDHDNESFVVNGVHFSYADALVTWTFHQTSSHGGPIREGLNVRIHYLGSPSKAEIVRLEVQQPTGL